MLVENGSNVHAQNINGNTPLHIGEQKILSLSVFHPNSLINTFSPFDFHSPAALIWGYEHSVRFLVEANSSLHTPNHNGKKALDFAEKYEKNSAEGRYILAYIRQVLGLLQDDTREVEITSSDSKGERITVEPPAWLQTDEDTHMYDLD